MVILSKQGAVLGGYVYRISSGSVSVHIILNNGHNLVATFAKFSLGHSNNDGLQSPQNTSFVIIFSTSLQIDSVLPNIEEFVNLVRKGVFESKAVGQGLTLCCTHISLIYVHFFHCKEIRDKLNAGTSNDICKYLANEYQFMILKGR